MSSLPFATLKLVVEDPHEQDKDLTTLNVIAIALSTVTIMAITIAATHLQRRKKKLVFGGDSSHPDDLHVSLYLESESEGFELDDRSNSYHGYVREIMHPRSPNVNTRPASPAHSHDSVFTVATSFSSSTCSDELHDRERQRHAASTSPFADHKTRYQENVVQPSYDGSARQNGYSGRRQNHPGRLDLGSEYEGSWVASQWSAALKDFKGDPY